MDTSERWAEGPSLIESIWRQRYLVAVVAILAGLAGYLNSQSQPPVYEATVRLHVANPADAGLFGQQGGTDFDRYLPQQVQRIRSPDVLQSAADELRPAADPAGLAEQLEVEDDLELGTLTITAQDQDPERAAAVANQVADAYQENVRTTQIERVQRAVTELDRSSEELQSQIDALLAESSAGAAPNEQLLNQANVLTQRLVEIDTLGQQLQVDARLFDSGVEFAERAAPPTSPVAPSPRRDGAAAFALGLLFASAFAYWRAGRGHRVEDRNDPAPILEVPLLGVLPTYKPPRDGSLAQRTELEPRTAEAYRFVYSSLSATLRDHQASSVMITSAGPATGKTESALQIAATAARRGQRVLLIDADLRMRGLTSSLRAERSPGLLDLAATHDGIAPGTLVKRYPIDGSRSLDVLTAGRMGIDDHDHLSEDWFGEAFGEVVRGYDLVVVDSPPLLAVADTTTIAGYTDAIVIVIREGSDLNELERVRDRLRFVQQRLVGYIFLTPSALEDSNFDYGLVRSKARQEPVDTTAPATLAPPSSHRSVAWDVGHRPAGPTGPAEPARQAPGDAPREPHPSERPHGND